MIQRRFHKPFVRLATIVLVGFGLTAAQAQQESQSPVVEVTVGEQVYGFGERPRLLKIYQAAELAPANYWASSRLVSVKQTEQLIKQRNQVVARLQKLVQVAQAEDEPELARAARAYAEQLPQWPLVGAEWIGVTKIDDTLEVQSGVDVERQALFSSFSAAASDLDSNPLLPAGRYQLLPPTYPGAWQVTVVSPLGAQRFKFTETDTVRSILKQAGLFDYNYALTEVELIALTGLAARTKVAYYNDAKALPPVHGLILVDLDLSSLDEEWQNLNQQISALARYWNPQS
ncbi:capsule biosynthesis GfcC D2 domain-containing protein [Pseudidiomarina sp. E22-M8]|uniref:capsule biosynthesis GfcC D2 domain-containing protein n=1 Tax=Pseudidiomarina sp. E22-M8 TaxID=3424768 RepID=UPI00403C8E75